MTQLIIPKDKMQDVLMSFLSTLQTDEIRLEFDDKHFLRSQFGKELFWICWQSRLMILDRQISP